MKPARQVPSCAQASRQWSGPWPGAPQIWPAAQSVSDWQVCPSEQPEGETSSASAIRKLTAAAWRLRRFAGTRATLATCGPDPHPNPLPKTGEGTGGDPHANPLPKTGEGTGADPHANPLPKTGEG